MQEMNSNYERKTIYHSNSYLSQTKLVMIKIGQGLRSPQIGLHNTYLIKIVCLQMFPDMLKIVN